MREAASCSVCGTLIPRSLLVRRMAPGGRDQRRRRRPVLLCPGCDNRLGRRGGVTAALALLVLSLGTLSLTFLVLKGWWP